MPFPHALSLHRVGVGDDQTFAEFIIDLNLKDGTKIYWHEIIYSVWKNGKIVHEEYFKGL